MIVDQLDTRTYARDLAVVILGITAKKSTKYGIYHYSSEGVCSSCDFAHAIFEESSGIIRLNAIATVNYPTSAERPSYSVLDKTKIKTELGINIRHWRESLKESVLEIENLKGQ